MNNVFYEGPGSLFVIECLSVHHQMKHQFHVGVQGQLPEKYENARN